VLEQRAVKPWAVLKQPEVLTLRTLVPDAVFALPMVLAKSVSAPLATLLQPVVLLAKADAPKEVVLRPVLRVQPNMMPATLGVAAETLAAAPQVKPVVQAAQAFRTWPSVPTARAEGVQAALAPRISPLAVRADLAI
jgi:hypothetical protein